MLSMYGVAEHFMSRDQFPLSLLGMCSLVGILEIGTLMPPSRSN